MFELLFLILILYSVSFSAIVFSFFLSALMSPSFPIFSSLPDAFPSSIHKISHFFELLEAGFQGGNKTNLIK